MAYKIVGNVYQICATEQRTAKTGSTFCSRSLILIQRRFDSNTGEEYEPNYPQFDFSGNQCSQLDNFKQGDRVQVSFDIAGVKFTDNQTHEEKFFSKLRAFKIEPYISQQQQMPVQQPMPQQYAQQQMSQQYAQQQYAPPQPNGGNKLPF